MKSQINPPPPPSMSQLDAKIYLRQYVNDIFSFQTKLNNASQNLATIIIKSEFQTQNIFSFAPLNHFHIEVPPSVFE